MMTAVLNENNLPYIVAIVSTGGMFAALGAWWVSWRESRRSNRVIVKLRRFSSHEHATAAGEAYELEVWIVNAGIQMQNISIALGFAGPGKSGTCQVPIPLSDHSKSVASTFLRGTTASFILSTADKDACRFHGLLRDFEEQRPVINVYSSSFLACSFPIYSRWDTFRKLWNRLCFRLSFKRRVGEGCEGKGVFRTYQLPYFQVRSEELRFFIEGVRNGLPPLSGPVPGCSGTSAGLFAPFRGSAGEAPEPSGEAREPSGEAPESSAEAPEPSGEAPESSREAPEPSGDIPEPSGEAPESSGEAPGRGGEPPGAFGEPTSCLTCAGLSGHNALIRRASFALQPTQPPVTGDRAHGR